MIKRRFYWYFFCVFCFSAMSWGNLCPLPYRVLETPSYVEVICGEQLEKYQFTFLPDVLSMVPGVFVTRPSASQALVGIRGIYPFSSTKSLLLIDDREPFLNFFGVTQWTLIPVEPEDVERIEIVRAPGTIYGGNALTGVIQIRTKDVQDSPEFYSSLKVGEGEWFQSSLLIKTQWEKLSGKWGVSGLRTEDGPPREGLLSARDGLLWGKWIYPIRPGEEYVFSFHRSKRKANSFVPLAVTTLPTVTTLQSYSLSYRHSQSPRKFMKNTFSWESNSISIPSTDQVPFMRGEIQKVSWDISGYQPWRETGFLSYGVSSRIWMTGTSPLIEDPRHPTGFSERFLFTKEISEPAFGAYIQGKLPLGKQSTMFAGGRWDWHFSAGDRFAPFFAFAWQPTFRSTARFSLYRAYRSPDLFELFSDFLLLDKNVALIFRGEENLSFERNDGIEVSWESFSERFRWEVQAYIEKLHQPIGRKFIFNPERGVNELVFSHLSDVRYGGLEWSGTYFVEPFSFFAKYFWNQPLDEVKELPFPHWAILAGMSWKQQNRLSFSVFFHRVGKTRWETGKKESFIQEIPPYSLLNLSTTYEILPNAQLHLRIWNFLDREFSDFFTYEQSRRIILLLEWRK